MKNKSRYLQLGNPIGSHMIRKLFYFMLATGNQAPRQVTALFSLIEIAKANDLAEPYLRYLFEKLPVAETKTINSCFHSI